MNNRKIRCRFAPSPTGYLHIGNIRTAIINYLFVKKNEGEFLLRFDDTDEQRVKEEYKEAIIEDMNWLGLNHDQNIIQQSQRLELYQKAKNKLIESNRIYECFETAEELNLQRKSQTINGQRPIYDRAALNLTDQQKENFRKEGRKSYWRFLLKDQITSWQDGVRDNIKFEGLHFSDPVIIRENGLPTYTFCSVVDDIDLNITDIIRGEDHITNTAIQIQIFQALEAENIPNFSHLALVKANEGKISKRIGGFDIRSLRKEGFEALSIINLLPQIGVSKSLEVKSAIEELIANFNLKNFSKSATKYNLDELKNINQKLLQILPFSEIEKSLKNSNINLNISEEFWHNIKNNLEFLHEAQDWINICQNNLRHQHQKEDFELLKTAKDNLPQKIDQDTWQIWINNIKQNSNKKGKELFMPLRLALTGKENGPELKNILPLIKREEILARLT